MGRSAQLRKERALARQSFASVINQNNFIVSSLVEINQIDLIPSLKELSVGVPVSITLWEFSDYAYSIFGRGMLVTDPRNNLWGYVQLSSLNEDQENIKRILLAYNPRNEFVFFDQCASSFFRYLDKPIKGRCFVCEKNSGLDLAIATSKVG